MAKTTTATSTTEVNVLAAPSEINFNEINPTENTVIDADAAASAAKALHDEYLKNGYTYNEIIGCYSFGGL